MSVKVFAYKCSFCGGHLRRKKKAVESHESRCFYNPIRKACATCSYFKKETQDSYLENEYIKISYCEKKVDISEKLKFKCPSWGLRAEFQKQGEMK